MYLFKGDWNDVCNLLNFLADNCSLIFWERFNFQCNLLLRSKWPRQNGQMGFFSYICFYTLKFSFQSQAFVHFNTRNVVHFQLSVKNTSRHGKYHLTGETDEG